MSLVTRCPACDTTFKVVRDQLRISDGWVRCGRCSQVFDATVDLHDASELAPPAPHAPLSAAPSQEAEPESPPAPEAPPDPKQEMVETDFIDDESGPVPLADAPPFPGAVTMSWPDADALQLGDQGRTAVRPPAPPPLAFPDIDLAMPLRTSTPDSDLAPLDAEDSGHAQLQKALRRARVKSARLARAQAREAAAVGPAEDTAAAASDPAPMVLAASEHEFTSSAPAVRMEQAPAFLGGDGSPTRWQRPAVRRSLVAAAVLGALLLAAQVLRHERDTIAARQPALRPLLATLCSVTGCELSALRQINDIKIDGASFARDKNGDGYQLGFTVRNIAAVPLAMPAVELSLLDTQERAVVRRVLLPADFGAPAVLPARAERSASLSLQLSGAEAASMPPVAGFRIEALYP